MILCAGRIKAKVNYNRRTSRCHLISFKKRYPSNPDHEDTEVQGNPEQRRE